MLGLKEKLSNKNLIIGLVFFINSSFLFGQKISHMNGAYDLDGDQMLEFIALELNPQESVFPNKVRYYEIDADSYQTLIWEFKPPAELAL